MPTLCLVFILLFAGSARADTPAPGEAPVPFLWRQFVPSSSTVEAAFQLRTPQFILYQNGTLIYRGSPADRPSYRQVVLTPQELGAFLFSLQQRFHFSGITPERLARELPYIQRPKTPPQKDANGVVIWMGVFNPPRTLRMSLADLKAHDGQPRNAPAWEALNGLNRFLEGYRHPRAQPFIPDRVELAVHPLPSRLASSAASAARWPLPDVSLRALLGRKSEAFQTLTGESARTAYRLLADHPVVTDGGTVYYVWVRPLLLP